MVEFFLDKILCHHVFLVLEQIYIFVTIVEFAEDNQLYWENNLYL